MTADEKYRLVIDEVDKILPPLPCVRLTPVREKTAVFSSKLGGVPYLPKDFPYPVVKEGELAGNPLKFLAQLNFGELPHIADFPEKGILQFFCSCDDDDVIGLEYERQFSQSCYRVIYHENVIEDESKLISESDMPQFKEDEDEIFPIFGEFLLKAEQPEMMNVSFNDFRFAKTERLCYEKLFGRDNDESYELYDESRLCDGTFIGGYPFFMQFDPRKPYRQFRKCDTLLFQIDSLRDSEEIFWGDGGVGNFFINRKDLINRDFSKVLYHWDCD